MNKLKIAGVRLGDELIPKQPHRHTVRSKASWTQMMSFSHTMRKRQESISNVRDSADTETWEVFYEEDVSVVGLAEGWKWGRETQIQREIEIQREREIVLCWVTPAPTNTPSPHRTAFFLFCSAHPSLHLTVSGVNSLHDCRITSSTTQIFTCSLHLWMSCDQNIRSGI